MNELSSGGEIQIPMRVVREIANTHKPDTVEDLMVLLEMWAMEQAQRRSSMDAETIRRQEENESRIERIPE